MNPFRYTARESDAETGLYYYRARYYDPATGRFSNEDPIQFDGGINLYAYVGNDPEDWGDPDGTQNDRRTTARPDGTPNPFKKLTPDPDDPNKVIAGLKNTRGDSPPCSSSYPVSGGSRSVSVSGQRADLSMALN